jgi:hypothetical protein
MNRPTRDRPRANGVASRLFIRDSLTSPRSVGLGDLNHHALPLSNV